MIESSLILLLRKFSKQQLKEFSNFVKSPYFNTNNALIKLYEHIRKQFPDYSPEKLEKEYVFKKLYGKTEYNYGFLRVLMSNLQSLAEEYLTNLGLQHEPLAKRKYLLDELTSIGAVKHAEKTVNEGLKEISGITPAHPDDYLAMYNIIFYKKYFDGAQIALSKNKKPDRKQYDEQKYFINHFLLRTLAYHFYQLNLKKTANYEPELIFLNEIIIFLENNPDFLELPMLNLTFLRVLLLKNNDIKDYYRLKKAFYEVIGTIDKQDAYNTVSIIMNYCQNNYALTEDEVFRSERFDIIKFAVENNLNAYDESVGFDPGRYISMTSFALELNEVEWTENFIEQHSSELKTERKDYLVAFAKAMLSFSKKQYDEAIGYLSRQQNPSDTNDKFNLKVLQMKIYYERDYFEQAESSMDSFRHLIQNDKLLPEISRESYKNFYSLYFKLFFLKQKNEKQGVIGFRDKLKSLRNVVSKEWLIDKAEEISKT